MLHSRWMEGAKCHASAGPEVAFVFLNPKYLVIDKAIVRGLSRFIARNRSSLPPGLADRFLYGLSEKGVQLL